MEAKRGSNIELYRVVSMILITVFHFSDHGNINVDITMASTFNWHVLSFVRIGGGLGNCAFVLITGYFLSSKEFKLQKLIRLWLQVFFYSTILGIVSFSLGLWELNIINVLRMIFPVINNRYWFLSTYFILYIMTPFLNILINNLNKKDFERLIIMLLVLFSLLPTLTPMFEMTYRTSWLTGVNSLPIFILLYFIGAYVKKYDYRIFIKNIYHLALSIGLCICLFISMLSIKYFIDLNYLGEFYFVWGMEKTPIVLTAISIFLYFKELNIKYNKYINIAASTVFGIYLLHTNIEFSQYIFKTIFNNSRTYYSYLLLPQLILAVILIMSSGIIVDRIRMLVFEKPIMIYVEKWLEKVSLKVFINKLKIVCVFLIIGAFLLLGKIFYDNYNFKNQVVNVGDNQYTSAPLLDNKPIEERIKIKASKITAISFTPVTWGKKFNSSDILNIRILNSNKITLCEINVKLNSLPDNREYMVNIKDLIIDPNEHYYISFRSSNNDRENYVALMMSSSVEKNAELYYGDIYQNGTLDLVIYGH